MTEPPVGGIIASSLGEPRVICDCQRGTTTVNVSPGEGGADMAARMVLSEDEAVELVAFLVTAARTQVDEAAEYGSLRLLTAAGRLGELIAERVSPETRALLTGPLKPIPEPAVPTADPAAYGAALARPGGAVGRPRVTHSGA